MRKLTLIIHRLSRLCSVSVARASFVADTDLTVLVMCGLPARGKSFISKKLERFLRWRGEQVQIFNVGERRRKQDGKQDASFFGQENRALREQIAQSVLFEMVRWLQGGGVDDADAAVAEDVSDQLPPANIARSDSGEEYTTAPRPPRTAIFDATNTTRARRRVVADTLARILPSCRVVFVESSIVPMLQPWSRHCRSVWLIEPRGHARASDSLRRRESSRAESAPEDHHES